MALGVLSYPQLRADDYERIQKFRKANDELYCTVAEPHFPFVFPVSGIDQKAFIAEIESKSRGMKAIDFEIKCATINKDAVLDYFHLLLVPDEGYSKMVRLHDKLYADKLFNDLRLDIDYIPHIGIANSQDPLKVKSWVDEWNKKDFIIKGKITTLTIVDYTDNILTDLQEIKLI